MIDRRRERADTPAGAAVSRWLGLTSGETDAPEPEHLLAEASRLIDNAPRLLLAAERAAATMAPGAHGRRRVGPGESFWQFRPFRDGDAFSDVDWRQSARGDELFVREQEWEAAQSVWLWLDRSASMDFRSTRALPNKQTCGQVLSLALLLMMLRAGERIGVLGEMDLSVSGQRAARQAATALAHKGGPGKSDDSATIPDPAPCPPFASLVLVSDFLMPLDALEAALRKAETARLRLFLLQIGDPAEERLPYRGRTLFQGPENEGELLTGRAEDLADDFERRAAAHTEALKSLARRRGQRLIRHRTDRPAEETLMTLAEAMATPQGAR